MIRVLVFLAFLIVAAFGLTWLADRPGEITLVWQGYQIETSLMVGLAILAVAVIVIVTRLERLALRAAPFPRSFRSARVRASTAKACSPCRAA